MEIEDIDLVGVEYPGRVENVDNMIKTLGGLTNISKVVKWHFIYFKFHQAQAIFSSKYLIKTGV